MPLTTVALASIADAIIGGSDIAKFNNANAHIGVGDDDTAFNAAQTDLLGTSFRQPMEATYPQRTDESIEWRGLFGDGDAEFEWLEWALFNANSSGVMLNRSIVFDTPPGTKASGDVWRLIAVTAFALA